MWFRSTLLPSAVPTLIDCPNPPKPLQGVRKPPATRVSLQPEKPPSKKRPRVNTDSDSVEETQQADQEAMIDPAILDMQEEIHALREQITRLKRTETCLRTALLSSRNKARSLAQKLRRQKKQTQKHEKELIGSLHKIKDVRNSTLRDMMSTLPDAPRAVIEVLMKGGKQINWSEHERTMELCLSVFFRSSSAYQQLRAAGFILPHPKTLRKRFGKVLRAPGFCPQLEKMIALRAQGLSVHEKLVVLSFDGMRLTPGLKYCKAKDQLTGFEDLGIHGKTSKVANEGVVVMVRGLTLKWKQVMGYFITDNCISSIQLKAIIEEAVAMLTRTGLTVTAIVMDQGSTQWKWVDNLKVSHQHPSSVIESQECFIIPDPPHLLKNLRNHFQRKDIEYTLHGKQHTAKWTYIKVS